MLVLLQVFIVTILKTSLNDQGNTSVFFFFLKKILFIYLFLERGEGREKERETSMCGCFSHAPYWGPGPQPRDVPLLGIEPVTL